MGGSVRFGVVWNVGGGGRGATRCGGSDRVSTLPAAVVLSSYLDGGLGQRAAHGGAEPAVELEDDQLVQQLVAERLVACVMVCWYGGVVACWSRPGWFLDDDPCGSMLYK